MAKWSSQEVELLEKLSPKYDVRELSKIFERSPHSINYKLRTLNLTCVKMRSEFNMKWNPEMISLLKSLRDHGKTWDQISVEIGKSKHACQKKYLRVFGENHKVVDLEKLEKELNHYFWDAQKTSEVLEIVKTCLM